MVRVIISTLLLWISGCSFQNYAPAHENLLSHRSCEHLVGEYRVNSEKFKNYSGLNFWSMNDYKIFSINSSKFGISFLARTHSDIIKTESINFDGYECDGKVLTIDIENGSTNNGGVSTYNARKLEIFSSQADEVRMRVIQTSGGLAFMVPIIVSEDSLVVLNRL